MEEFFGRNVLGGFFGRNSFLIYVEGIDLFVKILVFVKILSEVTRKEENFNLKKCDGAQIFVTF